MTIQILPHDICGHIVSMLDIPDFAKLSQVKALREMAAAGWEKSWKYCQNAPMGSNTRFIVDQITSQSQAGNLRPSEVIREVLQFSPRHLRCILSTALPQEPVEQLNFKQLMQITRAASNKRQHDFLALFNCIIPYFSAIWQPQLLAYIRQHSQKPSGGLVASLKGWMHNHPEELSRVREIRWGEGEVEGSGALEILMLPNLDPRYFTGFLFLCAEKKNLLYLKELIASPIFDQMDIGLIGQALRRTAQRWVRDHEDAHNCMLELLHSRRFSQLDPVYLKEPLEIATERNDLTLFNYLTQHPNFNRLSREALKGLLVNTATKGQLQFLKVFLDLPGFASLQKTKIAYEATMKKALFLAAANGHTDCLLAIAEAMRVKRPEPKKQRLEPK
jgi:hypothetical protein